MPSPVTACEGETMTFDYALAAAVTAGLPVYLTSALDRKSVV